MSSAAHASSPSSIFGYPPNSPPTTIRSTPSSSAASRAHRASSIGSSSTPPAVSKVTGLRAWTPGAAARISSSSPALVRADTEALDIHRYRVRGRIVGEILQQLAEAHIHLVPDADAGGKADAGLAGLLVHADDDIAGLAQHGNRPGRDVLARGQVDPAGCDEHPEGVGAEKPDACFTGPGYDALLGG